MAVNKRLLQGAAGAGEFVPSEHFGVVLYEGDGASSHSINGGKFGAGVYGNQSTSRVTTNYTQANGVELTWSFWVFSGATAGIDTIIGAGTQFIMALEANKLYPMINGSNRGAGTSITADTWHHFAITYNGSGTTQVYKDGSLDVTVTGQTPTSMGTIKLFDSDETGWGVLEGKIDQVRIFQKVLSSSEVSTLYAETAETVESLDPLSEDTTDTLQVLGDSSCVATYRFENDETDLSGNYNGTGTAIQYAVGRYGQAASFNGSGSKITTSGKPLNGNTTVSISFWAKNISYGNYVSILGEGGDSSTAGYRVLWKNSNDGNMAFARSNGSGGYIIPDTYYYDFGVDGSNWVHCAFTVSASEMKYYKNGENVLTQSVSNTATTVAEANFGICSDPNYPTHLWSGQMDQVRLFNKTLSASEVTTLYQENSLVASYRFEGNANDDTRNYDGTATNVTYEYGLGFTPDFVWIKNRTSVRDHMLFDSTRGTTNPPGLYPNLTNAEFSGDANNFVSFDTGGFTVGQDPYTNENGSDMVAWAFKANGGTTSSNTDGDITSTVQANQDAGFSIVQYDGNGINGSTVGHNLNAEPEVIIIKSTTFASHWPVYHKYNTGTSGSPETEYVRINSSNATATTSVYWGNTAPTSSVFSIGTDTDVNKSGETNIAYCFHSVDGFSKIGTYTGTGTTGNAQVCGFEPAFLLSKRISSTSDWYIIDNKRNTTNPRNNFINANTSDAEYNPSYGVNFNSNGFSFISTDLNGTGQEWIYMAFAADPDTEAPTLADSFGIKTYTGTGSSQSITGLGFAPNLVWVKQRGGTTWHNIQDTINGATKHLYTNATNAQDTTADGLTSFDSDGFTLGGGNGFNGSSQNMVAWAWKADDNEPTINTEGSIDSLVSANANAGFSIVKYKGNQTSGATVGHGLSAAPEMVIIKNLDSAVDWMVGHTSPGWTKFSKLNQTDASTTSSIAWNNTAPSSTVVTLGTSSGLNSSGVNYIMYAFHSVSGYSAFGHWTGGTTTITIGFRADFVLYQDYGAAGGWAMVDSVRGDDVQVSANSSNAESSQTLLTITDTGFTVQSESSVVKRLYMAYKIN